MTTVYRLPEEPPVGTTVRPVEDDRICYKRAGHGTWLCPNDGVAFLWAALFLKHPGGLRVVEPDPHPTPWTVVDAVNAVNEVSSRKAERP